MTRNTPLQNDKKRGWRTAFSVILSALFVMLTLFSAASYADQKQTFVLGNYRTDIGYFTEGPSSDGTSVMTYPAGRTVYFSRTSELAPANVTISWNDNHGSASKNTAAVYCNTSDSGTSNPLSFESGLVSAGTFGGVNIFKTNITGLYFSLTLRSFSAYSLHTEAPSSLPVVDGIMHNVIKLSDTDGCHINNSPTGAEYFTMGGVGFYAAITFYTDQTYTPGNSTITLLKKGNYHLRLWNEDPGPGIANYSENITFDISAVSVAEPTCTTQPVASGSSVSGTTVDLGSYSPNDIIKGVSAVPFSIKLAGCKGLRNINVTLTTTTVASTPTLLGNILTSNHATGVGVEISGAANNYSSQMVMIPNDTTSVYNDQRDTSSDDNIYGTSENGQVQSQTLNFLATLKRDGNQKIEGGNFKANGIFTFDYP
ncbi:fimbrial protein [Salmonella bongori]|uniref:fimbrial protein n=1 Tax=Salmonella bongori TaxID=54736 RepID=UPI001559E1E7|nr:fimbrial protein [Salmonella bongori]